MPPTERFQFFIVTRKTTLELDLQRVRLSNELQVSLTKLFLEQFKEFTNEDTEKHAFTPTYKPDDNEVLVINPFALPDLLARAATKPQEFPYLTMPFTEHGPMVKAIVALDDGASTGTKRYFFQHFDGKHILKPKWTLLFKADMFEQLTDPGVTISPHLDAVLIGPDLLFRSFHLTNQFLDLTSHFKEATNDDIRAILGHRRFCKANVDAIIAACKPAMRKKFSAILHSKILDNPNATPDRIKAKAKKFEIDVHLKGPAAARQIVFPEDPKEAMKLLRFLAEELYFGEITNQLFASNSRRPVAVAPTP